MEASLRMGINTCNGINDMPDTDDVSALSGTISKRRQQVEIRPQGAQTLACHFPSASYIDDGRNRQKDNGLRNHRATPIRSPLQRLGLCCLHRFDGQQMQKIPMDNGFLICPDDWIIVNPEQAESSSYACVVECRNAGKFGLPHLLVL